MIKSIRLIKFKHFLDTEIELKPFSILMGENNCGKTSVLQAIRLANDAITSNNILKINRAKKAKKNQYYSGYMYEVPGLSTDNFPSLFYGKNIGSPSDKDGGLRLAVKDDNENIIELQFKNLFRQLHIRLLSDPAPMNNVAIDKYKPLFISGFVGLNLQEERLTPALLRERSSTGNISTVIRNLVLEIKNKNPQKYESLSKIMKEDFCFDIAQMAFDENNDLFITSQYYEFLKDSPITLDFSSSGSGILQILQILATIFKYCPDDSKLVLIDEPDAHLHNNLQIKFANILRKIQRELDIQIIISTHSTAIIREAYPEEVIPVSPQMSVNKVLNDDFEKQHSIADRLDSYELAKAKISGKIAFFEDKDLAIYENMARMKGLDCFSGLNTIPIIRGRGKDDKTPISLFEVLKEILGIDIEIHVVRDSDGLTAEIIEKMQKKAQENHAILHILKRYEIENYVLNGSLIHRALTKSNPAKLQDIPTVDEINNKILSTLKDTITNADYDYKPTLAKNLFNAKNKFLGENSYSPDNSTSEANDLYNSYKLLTTIEDLLIVGMGKETLKKIFNWLNSEKKLSISVRDLCLAFEINDIPQELENIFLALQSVIMIDRRKSENTISITNEITETKADERFPIDLFDWLESKDKNK